MLVKLYHKTAPPAKAVRWITKPTLNFGSAWEHLILVSINSPFLAIYYLRRAPYYKAYPPYDQLHFARLGTRNRRFEQLQNHRLGHFRQHPCIRPEKVGWACNQQRSPSDTHRSSHHLKHCCHHRTVRLAVFYRRHKQWYRLILD